MNNIFKAKENDRLVAEHYKSNLETPEWNQVPLGAKSLKIHGSNIWNIFPCHIKSCENLNLFNPFMTEADII